MVRSHKPIVPISNIRIAPAADLRIATPAAKRVDPELQTKEYREWALAVKQRAGWRCQVIENGKRCHRSRARGDRMVADHIIERKDGGGLLDLDNGQCSCVPHNTAKGLAARAARMRERF